MAYDSINKQTNAARKWGGIQRVGNRFIQSMESEQADAWRDD